MATRMRNTRTREFSWLTSDLPFQFVVSLEDRCKHMVTNLQSALQISTFLLVLHQPKSLLRAIGLHVVEFSCLKKV